MTTIQEVNINISIAEYLKNNGLTGITLDEHFTISREDYVGSVGYDSLDVVNWLNQSIPKPTESELITIYDSYITQLNSDIQNANKIESSVNSLKDFSDLARQFGTQIKDFYLLVMQSDFDSDDTDTRFSNFSSFVSTLPVGFRNRFNAALLAEEGLLSSNIGSFTQDEKMKYVGFCRKFITVYGQLLIWSLRR